MWDEFADFLRNCSRKPQIWWRDDDATADSQSWRDYRHALRDMPVLVAVIGGAYEKSLVSVVRSDKNNWVAQHGYKHVNHAKAPHKKCEYPSHRNAEEVLSEWQSTMEHLQKDFGGQFLPVFVPPWNRLSEKFMPHLAAAGFIGVSCFGGASQKLADGVMRYDTHIDIIDWRRHKRFIGGAAVLQALKQAIAQGTDPIGIMTHHKTHCSACTSFLLDLTGFLQDNQTLAEVIAPPFKAE